MAVSGPQSVPASWFSGATAPAVGIISTSTGPAPVFPASWDFLEVQPAGGEAPPSAMIAVGAPGLNSSTFNSGSFRVTNDSPGGQQIASVRLDLSTSVLPDLVFDPVGVAGDSLGKGFTVDADPGSERSPTPSEGTTTAASTPHGHLHGLRPGRDPDVLG